VDDLPDSEYRALSAFRSELRRFLQFSETAAKQAGVEPQQHQLMLAIRGLPPGEKPTISTIASQLLLKHHSTVELIDRSEKRGLVARTPDSEDGRAVVVSLTAEGKCLLRSLSVAHRKQLIEHAPGLDRALHKLCS
jgi:DNA-binding MarR family transcriptional regulator